MMPGLASPHDLVERANSFMVSRQKLASAWLRVTPMEPKTPDGIQALIRSSEYAWFRLASRVCERFRENADGELSDAPVLSGEGILNSSVSWRVEPGGMRVLCFEEHVGSPAPSTTGWIDVLRQHQTLLHRMRPELKLRYAIYWGRDPRGDGKVPIRRLAWRLVAVDRGAT